MGVDLYTGSTYTRVNTVLKLHLKAREFFSIWQVRLMRLGFVVFCLRKKWWFWEFHFIWQIRVWSANLLIYYYNQWQFSLKERLWNLFSCIAATANSWAVCFPWTTKNGSRVCKYCNYCVFIFWSHVINLWPFTQKGGLTKFHTMAIFTVLAVKVLKNYWNVSRREKSHGHHEICHAVKKVATTMKIFHAVKKGCNVWEIFWTLHETKCTSWANISLLPCLI